MAEGTWHRQYRALALLTPTAIVALAAVGATEWTNWLHAGAVADLAVAPAAGIALAAFLLLEPALWTGPLVAVAAAVAAVDLRHDVRIEIGVGHAVASVAAALVAAWLLRWYAAGRFHLVRVRELLALIVTAAIGGAVGAAIATGAVAIAGSHELWRAAYHHALANAFGLLVIPSAALTWRVAPPRRRRRGGRVEAAILAVAVVGVSVGALARWSDPLAYSAVLLLIWAALRFGPRGVALSGMVMAAAADWAAARHAGPFTGMPHTADAVLLLQVFVAVSFVAMLGLAFALDERDRAEATRWVAAERFRRTFKDPPIGMVVATLDGCIVETNRALCEMLGYTEQQLVGRTLRSLRPEDSGEHEIRAWPTGPEVPDRREQRLIDARGEIVWVEISESRLRQLDAAPEFKIVVIQNVTERKNLQQQLVHAQKMESVGRLAGGIAHDFNNVLAIMRGQVELLQDDLVVLDQARARIDSVQRATDRAAALTDDLMAFSRRRVDEPVPFDLHELLRSLRELLHQVLGATVAFELRLDASPSTIIADPNRIEQAVLNLAVNARDAMPAGGRLTITTRTDPPPTCAVVLSVSDTGVGMDPATRARIFEPFFTTKPPGLGTGLGLSTTDDIVKSAGGTIEVESDRGTGTTFMLSFPGLPSDTIDEDAFLHEHGDDAPTVLVVDDEPDVRTLVTEILRTSGYRVVAAPDGDAALALLERAHQPVDLLVTDVVMPVMSGTDLAVRVTQRSPATRVLYMSGFVPAGSAALRGAPLISKPLRRAQLLDAVHAVLDGAAPNQGTKR